MLPVEKAKGHIWRDDQFLCDVEYDIGELMKINGSLHIQRIVFILPEEHCVTLLNATGLTLVLADGRRFSIPRPFERVRVGCLECYVESLA